MIVALLIFFILLTSALSLFCFNLFKQNVQLEGYLKQYSANEDQMEIFYRLILGILTRTATEMDKVDKRGSFSSDDEVGFAFKVISRAIETAKRQMEAIRVQDNDQPQGQ